MASAREQLIEHIDAVIAAMAAFQARIGREVEVIVRTDGSFSLMTGDEEGTSFEEAKRFESIEYLMFELQLGGFPAELIGQEQRA